MDIGGVDKKVHEGEDECHSHSHDQEDQGYWICTVDEEWYWVENDQDISAIGKGKSMGKGNKGYWGGQGKGQYGKAAGKGTFQGKCYNCGEQGHSAKFCPKGKGKGKSTFQGNCYNCGQPGHFARECRMKGKGGKSGGGQKGKGYEKGGFGPSKGNKGSKGFGKDGGKGYGKGGMGKGAQGCFICGGPHMQRDCPNRGGHVRALEEWNWHGGEVRQLAGLCTKVKKDAKTAEDEKADVMKKIDKAEKKAEDGKSKKEKKESTASMEKGDAGESKVKAEGGDADKVKEKRKEKEKADAKKELRSLQTIVRGKVSSLGDGGEWEELVMAVDSGASETVVNEEMLPTIETIEGVAYRQGVEYELASGETIPNQGEKVFTGESENCVARQLKAQVCAVNKALLSVSKVVSAGNRLVFDEESYIEDKATGERIWLTEKHGMYMLKMWVKKDQSTFQRQGQ